MNPTELTASLGFLSDAGHLLAIAAPETSAYLMARRNDLMFEHELILSDKHRQHVCSCCGRIMLLSQGSELRIGRDQKAGQKPQSSREPKGKGPQNSRPQTSLGRVKVVTCDFCGRLTNVKLPAPSPITRRKAKPEKVTKTSRLEMGMSLSRAAQEAASQKTTTSNASSKKRAKSRKAGLQALLNQSSSSRNSGPGLGLSLADFMQK